MPAIPTDLSAQLGRPVERLIGPKSLPEPISPKAQQLQVHALFKRDGTIAIPTLYQNQNSSPAPGAVVGIVLGSVAAFLLLIWLFSTLTGQRNTPLVTEEEVVVSRRRSRSPRSRRSRRSEMTSRSPRQDRIIRQERIVRDTSRAPRGERYIVTEETREPIGGNTVEVVEEGESSIVTAPRHQSRRRGSRY
ncbi:hypothetical protein K461DRAFT_264719 [Myriangium duriaei CBS 260.36]|uniref:Uncharacterized protein n=1 Tax=Myriangium duriaei CBS 260.36 TaxID=1168546 RepID=A0A9P4J9N8_9PEZI|nr:hypothetical protein K461DRAFT_264719 [Myriangium duriaei CBS 260.36]